MSDESEVIETAAASTLQGSLDVADWTRVEGWAFDPAKPDRPVELELLDNGELVASFQASQHRADLEAAGVAGGHCAFFISVPGGWSPLVSHLLEVRAAESGAALPNSPVKLVPEPGLTPALARSLHESLRDLAENGTQAERDEALRLLVRQADTLLRARAETDGSPPQADMAAFYARWGELLDNTLPPVPKRPAERPPVLPRRALIVVDALGDLDDPGLRAVMQSLSRLGHDVNLIAGEPGGAEALRPALEAEGVVFHGPPYTASVEEGLRRHAGLFDAVVLHQASCVLAYAALARRHVPKARLALHAGALESAALAKLGAENDMPEMIDRARRARTQETIAVWSVDTVMANTQGEVNSLREGVPNADVNLLPEDPERLDAMLRKLFRVPRMAEAE
jgi:hypothetical protein